MTLVCWKIASHPLSQSCPMDSRFPDFRSLKNCASVALAGTLGMLSCAMLDEYIAWLLGQATLSVGADVS